MIKSNKYLEGSSTGQVTGRKLIVKNSQRFTSVKLAEKSVEWYELFRQGDMPLFMIVECWTDQLRIIP